MEVIINGAVPNDPRARVMAIESCTRAICKASGEDPADGIMMLLTAAAHLHSQYSGKPISESVMGLASALGHATVAAEGFFTLRQATPTVANTSAPGQKVPKDPRAMFTLTIKSAETQEIGRKAIASYAGSASIVIFRALQWMKQEVPNAEFVSLIEEVDHSEAFRAAAIQTAAEGRK
jgi:hypothetical protein